MYAFIHYWAFKANRTVLQSLSFPEIFILFVFTQKCTLFLSLSQTLSAMIKHSHKRTKQFEWVKADSADFSDLSYWQPIFECAE